MLEAATGIATLAYLAVSGIIAVRLLRLAGRTARVSDPPGRATRLPEFRLGLFFLLYSCIGSAFNVVAYAGWSKPELGVPLHVVHASHAAFFWLGAAGITALLAFVRQTFRPGASWASAFVVVGSLTMFVTAVAVGISEGYAVRVVNGPFYWIQFVTRDVSFAWIAVESLSYWDRLRRRLALGLADPVLVNRFLLIGIWGGSLAVLSLVDPLARWVYYLQTGSVDVWNPALGGPILLLGLAVTTGLLAVSVAALGLAFFPTGRFVRWLETRGA